jgi:hypothetical protein
MTRTIKIGSLAGLFGLCIGMGAAVAQLPPLPSDPIPAPVPAPMPAEENVPVFDPPPTLPTPMEPTVPPVPPSVEPSQEPWVEPSQEHSFPMYQPDPLPPVETEVAPIQVASPQSPGYYGDTVVPGVNSGPKAWQPGGYEPRTGRPYYYTVPGRNEPLYMVHDYSPTPWAIDHSAYQYHFGPGYYRHSEGGHYRFPYYTYRAPWYFPGHPIFNRDTNRPW